MIRTGNKSRMTAVVLAFLLGWLGVHKFYLGRPVWGVLYVLFCWTLVPCLVAWIEMIMLLLMSEHEFDLKYNSSFR